MNIGFDAKRAFHNVTGLGNYSRTLIDSLATYYPEESYYLFNPKKSSIYIPLSGSIHEINPVSIIGKAFPSLWRSRWIISDINKFVNLYHGLSNELPYGIHQSKVKKVVTIHDLIFEYFPDQYNRNDILIYRKKFKYACEHADKVIAISESTKKDIISLYSISAEKIEVCYQSCDLRFFTSTNESQKQKIIQKYNLNKPYFLYVGSIIERKNLLSVCEAFVELQNEVPCNLVIIGKGNNQYKEKVMSYLNDNYVKEKVIFLEDNFLSSDIHLDLPALYQNAFAFLYPSVMEGFGIPVLEAMASGIPVITSNKSSLPEVGGAAAQYINPNDKNQLYLAMKRISFDSDFRNYCIKTGFLQAQKFAHKITAQKVMTIYKQLNS